jgi:outer membrane lipopolysaccharide assembly protein LptE/RlpB
MPKQMKYAALIVLAIIIPACSWQKRQLQINPGQERRVILAKQENAKYKLTAIF